MVLNPRLSLNSLVNFKYFLFVSVNLCAKYACQSPQRLGEGVRLPGDEGCDDCKPGIELWSSARASSSLNHQVVSPVLLLESCHEVSLFLPDVNEHT